MSIDTHFEDHQIQLAEAARDVFARRNTPTDVRELEAGDIGYNVELWDAMAGLGWLGLAIGEDYGGGAGGFLELYPIFEEMGRALVGGPHLDTLGVAAPLIDELGTEGQKKSYLTGIASGEATLALAVLEAAGDLGADAIGLRADDDGDGYLLTGSKLLVPYANSVSRLLVVARTGEGADDVTLFLVSTNLPGLGKTKLHVIPGVPMYEVSFDDVAVARDAVLGPVGGGWEPLQRAMTRAAVLQTAMIVGAARTVLDFTAAYARDREQFGIPIGKNQAVQYMVSDILLDMHRADYLGRQAAFRIHTGRSFTREAAIAVAFAKEACAHLMRQSHEVHAGVAFIHEHDLTLFSRMGAFWETHLGDARHYRDLLNATVL